MDKDVLLERERIEKLGESAKYNQGFHSKVIGFGARTIKPFYKGKKCLILGPSEVGEIEKDVKKYFKEVTCVDGSEAILKNLKNKFPDFECIHSLFEEFKTEEKFDIILMTNILEHVKMPVELLKLAKTWLKKEGRIMIIIPNAFSIHRMLGVEMGIIKNVHDLDEADKKVGHRRVYDYETLKKEIIEAGLKIEYSKGIFLKVLHNSAIEKFKEEQIEGFFKLGERFPENCAELLFICSLNAVEK